MIFERSFLAAADSRLDISDDDIDTLNSHLVKLEVVWGEAIVRNDDIGILLGGLDILFKGRFSLVFVCL